MTSIKSYIKTILFVAIFLLLRETRETIHEVLLIIFFHINIIIIDIINIEDEPKYNDVQPEHLV